MTIGSQLYTKLRGDRAIWMIVIVLAIAGALAWNLVIRPVEEADLADRFGVDYDRYHASVDCWLPKRSAGWTR
mgnify:CR=1 FL=1